MPWKLVSKFYTSSVSFCELSVTFAGLQGPAGTPYEEGTFYLDITLPERCLQAFSIDITMLEKTDCCIYVDIRWNHQRYCLLLLFTIPTLMIMAEYVWIPSRKERRYYSACRSMLFVSVAYLSRTYLGRLGAAFKSMRRVEEHSAAARGPQPCRPAHG